MHRKNPLVSSS
ncbi:Protein of unknown function [Bacillus mycoides]|uniref:Uncharacterized protein n=1 Tax=Bacillus mycoides TaxID=1405 RepID=A0A1D3MTZ2_BACMY|nr:Protein of unknown function [Bacillus mycoides]SCM89409.1 Protein of unknown function [Bacillus mycoides]SCM97980.1 Protein of unknown function [Bacillus mycoides]